MFLKHGKKYVTCVEAASGSIVCSNYDLPGEDGMSVCFLHWEKSWNSSLQKSITEIDSYFGGSFLSYTNDSGVFKS